MRSQRQFQATLWRRPALLLLVFSLPQLSPTSALAESDVTFITVDQSDDDIWQADEELRTYLEQGIDPPGRKFNQLPITYEEVGWTLARWESDGGGGSHVARVTPYVYVAAEMLGADLEVLGTYESTATDSVVYHSYFVVNRDHLSLPAGEPPRLHHLLEWLRSQSEPAKFTYHSRFSTSSYFVPSLFFRRNRIFSMRSSDTEGVIAIDTEQAQENTSSTDLVRSVAEQQMDGQPIFAAVWDGTRKKFELEGVHAALGKQVYFIQLPEALPNDLLVCSRSLPSEMKEAIRGLLGPAAREQQRQGVKSSDIKWWVDINTAPAALKAVSALRWKAKEAPAPVTVTINPAEGSEEDSENELDVAPHVEAAKQAVRLSGTEFVLRDPNFHMQEDYVWTVELVREGHIKLASQIVASTIEDQTFRISFRPKDMDELAVRIGELIQSRLHRIRYVWPYEQNHPLVIRDVPFSLPAGTEVPFREIVWRDPMTNSYTRGREDSVRVTSTDYFKFNLDKESVGEKLDSFDPMSNVSHRLVLARPEQPQWWFTFFAQVFWGLIGLSLFGTVLAVRSTRKLTRAVPLSPSRSGS